MYIMKYIYKYELFLSSSYWTLYNFWSSKNVFFLNENLCNLFCLSMLLTLMEGDLMFSWLKGQYTT